MSRLSLRAAISRGEALMEMARRDSVAVDAAAAIIKPVITEWQVSDGTAYPIPTTSTIISVTNGVKNGVAQGAAAAPVTFPIVPPLSGSGRVRVRIEAFIYGTNPGASPVDVFLCVKRGAATYGFQQVMSFPAGTTATKRHTGSVGWDPPSVAAGASTSSAVTVTGAVVGDHVLGVGFSLALPAGVFLTGTVTAPGVVTYTLTNLTSGAVDLGSGTVQADVLSPLTVPGGFRGKPPYTQEISGLTVANGFTPGQSYDFNVAHSASVVSIAITGLSTGTNRKLIIETTQLP